MRPFVLLAAIFSIAVAADKPLIAVSDLDARGMQKSDAQVISDQLRAELHSSGKFRVIERSQMEAILKEQGFQQVGCTSDACAVEAGQLLGVKYIVVGSLGAAGSYTLLSSRVVDVSNGEVIVNRTVKNTGGVDALIERGTGEMARLLTTDFFAATEAAPAPAEAAAPASVETVDNSAAPTPATEKQFSTSPRKKRKAAPLIIAGGLVVVGGGVAALAILGGRESAVDETETSLQIDLR